MHAGVDGDLEHLRRDGAPAKNEARLRRVAHGLGQGDESRRVSRIREDQPGIVAAQCGESVLRTAHHWLRVEARETQHIAKAQYEHGLIGGKENSGWLVDHALAPKVNCRSCRWVICTLVAIAKCFGLLDGLTGGQTQCHLADRPWDRVSGWKVNRGIAARRFLV